MIKQMAAALAKIRMWHVWHTKFMRALIPQSPTVLWSGAQSLLWPSSMAESMLVSAGFLLHKSWPFSRIVGVFTAILLLLFSETPYNILMYLQQLWICQIKWLSWGTASTWAQTCCGTLPCSASTQNGPSLSYLVDRLKQYSKKSSIPLQIQKGLKSAVFN